MVMFCLMIKRRINLMRLVLDFTLSAIHVERRRYATLPYGMFLTRVFLRALLPMDGHSADNKCLTTTMKTFLDLVDALSLIEKEGGKEREEEGRQEEGQKEK